LEDESDRVASKAREVAVAERGEVAAEERDLPCRWSV
jgi:hypothetical protein